MKLNFLSGSLIFRKHKTGVHIVHEQLFKQVLLHKDFSPVVSVYNSRKNIIKTIGEGNSFLPYARFSYPLTRFLSYLMPIEIFFGQSDIYFCDGIIPWTLYKSKKVCIIHDLMVYRYPQYYSIVMRLYLKAFFYQSKKADLIVTVSEATKKDIIKYLKIPECKIAVINCGFNRKNIIDEEISINVPEKYIFYIGDSRENKNLDKAIQGFYEYKKYNVDNMKFIIAGGGDKSNLKKLVHLLELDDDVCFCGYVSEAEKTYLYKNCFAFIFVSLCEGFGIPILEAMSYGIPVITSNLSSMKEIAEGYAILVNPNNTEDIRLGIEMLNDNDKRERYSKLGFVCIEKYTWEQSYIKLKEAIFNMLDA